MLVLAHTHTHTVFFPPTMPSLLNTPGGLCECVCVNKLTLKGSLFATIRHGPTKLTFFNALRIMRPSSTACEPSHFMCVFALTLQFSGCLGRVFLNLMLLWN